LDVDLRALRQAQLPNGAILASTSFATYRYSWFRDGAFSAYALDLCGEHERAAAFHAWAASVVEARAQRLVRAAATARDGLIPDEGDLLHARYAPAGQEGEEHWLNHQLDGSGAWLWSVAEHARLSRRNLPSAVRRAAAAVARYLEALASLPCADCWEENSGGRHPSSLAAVAAGLRAAARTGICESGARRAEDLVCDLRAQAVGGFLPKSLGSKEVDSNLLWIGAPWEILAPDDPLWVATLGRIRAELRRPGGGVHRYLADTYYGGGEWILLAGWLAINLLRVGEEDEAEGLGRWVESARRSDGALPEQLTAHALHPTSVADWVSRWGPVATPLTWSHATQLTLQVVSERAPWR
jgi:GH15 family glucan-1,4-alpha-glucosidase